MHRTRGENWSLRRQWQVHGNFVYALKQDTKSKYSGKTSLILAMFRMIELSEGSIHIDGMDISKLPRSLVRSRLVAIPQKPFLFDGPIRLNLDPTRSKSDDILLEVLQKVQLGNLFKAQGYLDKTVDEVQLSH